MALAVSSLAAASALALPCPAFAQTRVIDIPAGPLSESIRRLSDLTGISIGYAGPIPPVTTRSVRRAGSAAEALRMMLDGSGLRAIPTGPSSFRIERVRVTRANAPPKSAAERPSEPEADIVVTARKRPELLSKLPATEHVVRGKDLLTASGVPSSEALVHSVPSLSMSSFGPGRNRLFLRGIGDGPLNGFNQGSVAMLLDEARLTYDAPDPDWELVDIDQVEVLEGPQGPLYGTGALGGLIKISTNAPDTVHSSAAGTASLSMTDDSGISNSQSAVLNVAVVPNALAVRAVGYAVRQSGWIDNIGGANNSNVERLLGGRIAIKWVPADRWTVNLTGALQGRRTRDGQYIDGDLGVLRRPRRSPEPSDLDAKLAMLTLRGPVGGVELTSITSLSRQEAVATYDATPLASVLGLNGTAIARDDRNYQLLDQELRISNSTPGRLGWLAGLSVIDAKTDANIGARDSTRKLNLLTLKRRVTEAALFGEASFSITPGLSVSAGARIFSSDVDDAGEEGDAAKAGVRRRIRVSGDASISWAVSSSATVFVRGATAYRPGGTNIAAQARQPNYEADELASVELGTRAQLRPGLSLDATIYAARWQHVQADELLANGLVSTRNAGNALNVGVEADIRWSVAARWQLSGGFAVQSARLETGGRASGIDDPRIPAVPQAAARFKLDRRFAVLGWDGQASVGLRYTGATHLTFDPALDRRTSPHATVDCLVNLSRDSWSIAVVGENLTNSAADTFAFGNPFRVSSDPERTPLRPRTIGITLGRKF